MMVDTSIATYMGNDVVENKFNPNVTSLTPLLQQMEYEQTRKIENEKIKKEEEEKVRRIQENNRRQKIKEKELLEEHNLKIKCERRSRIGDMIKQDKLNTIVAKTRVLDAVMNKKILNSEDVIYQDLIESKVKKLLDSDDGRGKVFSCINQDRTYNIDYLQKYVSYNKDWKEFYRYNYTTNKSIYRHYKEKYYLQIKVARSNMGKLGKIYSLVISAPLLLLLYFISLILIGLSNLWCVNDKNEVDDMKACRVLSINESGKVWAIALPIISLFLLYDLLVLIFYFYLKKKNTTQIKNLTIIFIIRSLLLLFLLFFFVFSIIFFLSANPVNVLYLLGLTIGILIPLPLTFLIKSSELMYLIQKEFIKGPTYNKTIILFIN
jgi:hypothetical protein